MRKPVWSHDATCWRTLPQSNMVSAMQKPAYGCIWTLRSQAEDIETVGYKNTFDSTSQGTRENENQQNHITVTPGAIDMWMWTFSCGADVQGYLCLYWVVAWRTSKITFHTTQSYFLPLPTMNLICSRLVARTCLKFQRDSLVCTFLSLYTTTQPAYLPRQCLLPWTMVKLEAVQ